MATTVADLSIPLFLTQKIQQKIMVDFCFFHETVNEIKKKLLSKDYDFIYIRDPFNYVYDIQDITEKINLIIKNKGNTYLIDKIQTLDDVFFEDKWHQYQLFSEFMPKTELLTRLNQVDNPKSITKKRISSRAKGIFFQSEDMKNEDVSDYIIQENIAVDKEYRVYVIFNRIINIASLKSPKTIDSKVQIINNEELTPEIISFTQKIIKENKFDFIGLDIAKSGNDLYLLEVNRSCLFNGYFKTTQVNLAETFIDQLLSEGH